MALKSLSLINAIGAKMSYLAQRQGILSQNIANADTPNYQPQDLQKVNFGRLVKNIQKDRGIPTVVPEKTSAAHIVPGERKENIRLLDNKEPYEVAPAGNAVVLEEQVMMAGRNSMDYQLMTNIYRKQVGMMRLALGRN